MEHTIYLDNAATTFPKPEVVYDRMDDVNRHLGVNAGRGSYALAKAAASIIDEARKRVCQMANGEGADVVLTPSVTIALNQILNGISWEEHSYVYVSPFEHNAVMRTLHKIQKEKKIVIRVLPVIKNGTSVMIDVEKMKYEFSRKEPSVVCITHISNVTGYILPVKKIFEEAKKKDAITILDASQSFGLLQIDIKDLMADMVAFAGHKTLYGPFGIGGFIQKSSVKLREYITGGTGTDSLNLDMPDETPTKYEAASMNIVAVAGLLAAVDFLDKQEDLFQKEKELSDYLIDRLKEIADIKLYIPEDRSRHIGIVSITVDGYASGDIGEILDLDFQIAVRTGYHCAPLIHKYLEDLDARGTVRISVGMFTTKKEIDKLVDALEEIIEEV